MARAEEARDLAVQDGSDLSTLSPAALRRAIRGGVRCRSTAGLAPGFLQGNLVILPERHAGDFLRYCQNNPKPCPLIGLSEPGSPRLPALGAELDIRTDLAGYRVFSAAGDYRPAGDLTALWRDDLVTFVLGCSFSFEAAVERAGIPVRHLRAGRNVPMYISALETRPAGPFRGPLVVSLRSFAPGDAIQAILIADRYRLAHGAPVHIGDPARIGIEDLMRPDFGDPPILEPGDIPVFWACGVTPQVAIRQAALEFAVTHEPGCMLVTDIPADAAEFTIGAPSSPGAAQTEEVSQ